MGSRLQIEEKAITREDDPCSVCGAELKAERVTYTQPVGELICLVTDVPADVCPQCGEQYLAPDTVDAIQDLIDQQREPETATVPLYHFPQAVS